MQLTTNRSSSSYGLPVFLNGQSEGNEIEILDADTLEAWIDE